MLLRNTHLLFKVRSPGDRFASKSSASITTRLLAPLVWRGALRDIITRTLSGLYPVGSFTPVTVSTLQFTGLSAPDSVNLTYRLPVPALIAAELGCTPLME